MQNSSSFESLSHRYGRLVSAGVPVQNINPVTFLRASEGQPRFYWESGNDHIAFAASGIAAEIVEWGENRFERTRLHCAEIFAGATMLGDAPTFARPRLFGGFSFSDQFIPDITWADFSPAHMVLPHFQLFSSDGAQWLTINAHVPFGENPHDIREDLLAALDAKIEQINRIRDHDAAPSVSSGTGSPVDNLNYPMPFSHWSSAIDGLTQEMKTSQLKKVVLARVAELYLTSTIDISDVLDYLAQQYQMSYRFLFEPRPGVMFYGATPELLISVQDRLFATMALAGSAPRGVSDDEDRRFADELLASDKDRYEHQIVIERIVSRLDPVAETLRQEDTSVLKLSNIQHLYTAISGKLCKLMHVLSLVELLHPTPALGGEPRNIALERIDELEPVPRGWYAAPVGWVDAEQNGQFTVAIRSAVAQQNRVWLYAGSGIVAGSNAQKEWQETALKFHPMLNALGIEYSELVTDEQ